VACGLTGCAEKVSVGIIGGADGPTSIVVSRVPEKEKFTAQTAVFPEGRWPDELEEAVPGEPYATCVRTAERVDELLQMEISLPEGVTISAAEEGEPVYCRMFAGLVNFYRDGKCVGTAGYEKFTQETIDRWDGESWDGPPVALAPEEEYKPIYAWHEDWLGDYTPVSHSEDYSSCAALCTAGDFTRGILYYDKACERLVGIELKKDAFTEPELANMASSIRLSMTEKPPLPAPAPASEAGYREEKVEFPPLPGSEEESAPFVLSVSLPEGWEVREASGQENLGVPYFPYGIWENGEQIGVLGYMTFEPVSDEDLNYREVYSGLMLGSVVNWDAGYYTPVAETENSCNAVTVVSVKDTGEEWAGRMPDAPVTSYPAILCYNEECRVYVAFAFREDGAPQDTLLTVAKSVRLEANKYSQRS